MAKTYYHRSTALATGIHAATNETEQAAAPGGAAGTLSATIAKGGSALAFCFTTPAGEPNSADWPSGTYRCILEVSAAGANISYGLRAAGTATGHFARVDSALSADQESVAQAEALFTGTGVKVASVSWNPAAGAASDRFECLVAATNANTMNNQSLSVVVDAPDANATNGGISDGPWPSAIVVTIGQALETDLAQAVAKRKTRQVGQALETDLAQALTRRKVRAVGQVLETDLSQAVGRLKRRVVAQTLEADVAQPLVLPKIVTVLQVIETDLAQAVGRLKAKLVGQTFETDVAQPVRRNPLARLIGVAAETDLAQAVTAVVSGGVVFRIRGLMRRR